MDINDRGLTRRFLLMSAGLSALAAPSFSRPAQTAAVDARANATEEANITLVTAFCNAWSMPNLDIDHLVSSYFTDDCTIRLMNNQLQFTGKVATRAQFMHFIAGGQRFELKILRMTAIGPIVANLRIDTTLVAAKPAVSANIASVFYVTGGKIREWYDFVEPQIS